MVQSYGKLQIRYNFRGRRMRLGGHTLEGVGGLNIYYLFKLKDEELPKVGINL